jgi:hypothetical protein
MMISARIIRRPPEGWKLEGWTSSVNTNKMITESNLTRNEALGTVQFYLLWSILFINVTAGIGILAQASPMMQDMFQKTPLQAAAVVSLISVFNAGGRFLWASSSDYNRTPRYLCCILCRAGNPFPFNSRLGRPCRMGRLRSGAVHCLHQVRRRLRYIPAFRADMFGT